jgi:hypothetical protein
MTYNYCDTTNYSKGFFFGILIMLLSMTVEYSLRSFQCHTGRDDIFKPTIGNKSLHKISNDNGLKVVNSPTSKNLVTTNMFPHRNINKYTWTSPDGKTQTD